MLSMTFPFAKINQTCFFSFIFKSFSFDAFLVLPMFVALAFAVSDVVCVGHFNELKVKRQQPFLCTVHRAHSSHDANEYGTVLAYTHTEYCT